MQSLLLPEELRLSDYKLAGAFYFTDLCTLNKNNMGKGDKKTKKGKIFKGSFGKSRPRNEKKVVVKKKEA